ncbi:MobQ family relaxase [Metabacillus idriensis]|uniref:MobQ family relaxase n=1 Tax=Metabacillus idriensis TaxID=324768 RepID=UPI00174820E8|nr:MobQ family relaxase [Metabacillus idriensis]
MAIYHLSMQIISRSKGQSAVAAAAYRSGKRLTDERTGEEKYYRRNVLPDTMILAPSNSPEWVQDRAQLWNEVERNEKRKDSQLAREMNIALPRELSNDKQKELLQTFVQREFVDKGMIADIAIHRDDLENPHAHIMLTMRTITKEGFGKKEREWNADFANSKENNRGFVKSSDNCLDIRERWAYHANQALENEGIQERISHLSHEARGLEELPSVHLGHVASSMEKDGKASERGNINRDRREYNALVVDLQKYREEKKALEDMKAREQVQKKKPESFNTVVERTELKEATSYLKAEPTLENIEKRRQQLDRWEEQINNNDQYLRWKDDSIREASEQFRWMKVYQNQMQEAQQRLNNLNWMNPLKRKNNLRIKEESERIIANAKDQLTFHDKKLTYYRDKLGFNTEQELIQIKNQHGIEHPKLIHQNQFKRKEIRFERDVFKKAETALKNAFIREIASKYPEQPELPYMSFETAQKIDTIMTKKGHTDFPLERIQQMLQVNRTKIEALKNEIQLTKSFRSRLEHGEEYLEKYEKYKLVVEKIETNPFLKGKTFVSKSAKEEYDQAITMREHFKKLLKKEGITGLDDLKKQRTSLEKIEETVPHIQAKIKPLENGVGLLESVIQGMEQASRVMMRKNKNKNNEQTKKKRKPKELYNGLEK